MTIIERNVTITCTTRAEYDAMEIEIAESVNVDGSWLVAADPLGKMFVCMKTENT